MCRGDRRESIFAEDADREMFLATLAAVVGRCGWLLHGYVLMGNHYHALLETPEANLVRGMTWLQTTYTRRYNARHRTSGHLFGGRYKAILVDPEEPRYFATLLDYLHLNPVRAGLVRPEGPGLLEYRWSSLRGYVLKRERAGWLTVERGLAALERADTVRDRRGMLEDLERRMREEAAERCGQVEVPGHESLQSTLQRGWYFGREAFRDWLLEKAGTLLERHRAGRQNYHGPDVADHGKERAKVIIEEGLRKLKLDRGGLISLRKSDPRKVRLAKAVRKECAVPLKWLAAELQMGSAMNVSRLTNRPLSELRNGAFCEGRAVAWCNGGPENLAFADCGAGPRR